MATLKVLVWIVLIGATAIPPRISEADGASCPSSCTCTKSTGRKHTEARCVNLHGLSASVRALPADTVKLTLVSLKLTTLPSDAFFFAPPLETIRMDGNNIEQVDQGAFDGLSKLNHLNLSRNSVESLQSGDLLGLSALETLDLSENGLADLGSPQVWADVPVLRYLYLDGNRLSSLQSGIFIELKKLLKLSVARNNLCQIGDTAFKGLSKLNTLFLSQNNLSAIPSKALKSVESALFDKLDLSDNPIQKLEDDAFNNDGCENLSTLYLDNLDLSPAEIQTHTFVGLKSLSVLYLRRNGIQSLRTSQFAHLARLNFIALDGNPLVCDCGMLDFANYAEVFLDEVTGNCRQPVYLRNRAVAAVSLSEFRCRQPIIKRHAGNMTVQVGNTATVCCHSESYREAVAFSWYLDDGTVVSRAPASCLTKTAIARKDEGTYTCVAMTQKLFDEFTLSLVVQPKESPKERSANMPPDLTTLERTHPVTIATARSVEDWNAYHQRNLIIIAAVISTSSVFVIALIMVYCLLCRRQQQRRRFVDGMVNRGLLSDVTSVPLVGEDSLELTNEAMELERRIALNTRPRTTQTSAV